MQDLVSRPHKNPAEPLQLVANVDLLANKTLLVGPKISKSGKPLLTSVSKVEADNFITFLFSDMSSYDL